MSHRVTLSRLEAIVQRINKMLDCPETPYTKIDDGRYRANVGNYHLSQAYGGVALHQMCSDGGGVRDVLNLGHVSKRELEAAMFAFIEGIECGKQAQGSSMLADKGGA